MQPSRWVGVAMLGGALVAPAAAGPAAAQEPEAIGPPDVLVRVDLVQDELELIRFVMGRSASDEPEIDVTGAEPHAVYFQALTMLRKADRLGFEQTREHATVPSMPVGEIRPADVYAVVEATLDRLHAVKRRLDIDETPRLRPRDPTATPTDVFRAAVQASRQLNLLLDRRFAPSDVFEQVTVGVGYAARLLERFPVATTIPEPPPFEAGKRPADVYRRLLECFQRIRRVATASGLPMLELGVDEARFAQAEPSDVYDIASLLVSELAFLHTRLDGAAPPREVYYAGPKFPSHVYQRAGLLERQLIELEARVMERPDWMRPAAR